VPTLAELDALVCRIMLPQPMREAAAMLRALRPLVEEAEAKRRIEAAGYSWSYEHHGDRRVRVWMGGVRKLGYATWTEAAAWAEAQAEKREVWSKPVGEMTDAEMDAHVCSLASKSRIALRALADAQGLYNPTTDRIRLSGEADQ
jgi:hypothetical protein